MKPLSFSEKAGNTIPKQIWYTKILNASIILVLSELTNKCNNVPLFLLIGLIGVDGLPGLILLKQHFTPGLVGTSTQWEHGVQETSWQEAQTDPVGSFWHPRSVELARKPPWKSLTLPAKLNLSREPRFSRWYPQPGPFESLPPEHVIADKGHGVNQELRLPARPFATVAVVKRLHCHGYGSLNTLSIFYSILASLKSQQGPHALELLARCHHLPLPLKGWAAFKPLGLFLPDAGRWPFCLSSSAL